jgi:2C-methyl-D-erythritol 2,4-cyclodiphosphate synthase
VDFGQKQKSMEADLCTTLRNSSSKITKKKKKKKKLRFFCRKNPRLSAQTEKTLSEK